MFSHFLLRRILFFNPHLARCEVQADCYAYLSLEFFIKHFKDIIECGLCLCAEDCTLSWSVAPDLRSYLERVELCPKQPQELSDISGTSGTSSEAVSVR